MPITIDSTQAPRTLRVIVYGPWPTVTEQRRVLKPLIKGGLLTADTRALIDIRLVDSTPYYDEVLEIIAAAEERQHWPLRRCYLVKSPVQFGLVRQMQSMAPPTMEIQVFTGETEALDWLSRE